LKDRYMVDKTTILVIDDEESMRDSCRQVLIKEGYRVEVAEDGTLGLERLKTSKPDLALVDLKMPGISGMNLLEKVKDIDPTIIAIVITGYATLESAIESMKRGAYDFLPKPFTPDELRIIIKRGLERRKLVLESIALQQEKEKMRKFFITMVSHQLRSPLATIQQNLEVVLGHMVGNVPEEQEKILTRMRNRIKDLLTLIIDWLDLSKIEDGKLVETFKLIPLDSILSETIKSLQPLAEEKKVSLHIDQHDLPLIKGDWQSLKQLFSNLIGNAIKFNRDEGRVNVTVQEKHSYIEIKISDTGIGIAKEVLPFVFDEFYQVKNSETRTASGTGLGLSIAKKIVEIHSGSITVESSIGKGSSFIVSLPKSTERNN